MSTKAGEFPPGYNLGKGVVDMFVLLGLTRREFGKYYFLCAFSYFRNYPDKFSATVGRVLLFGFLANWIIFLVSGIL